MNNLCQMILPFISIIIIMKTNGLPDIEQCCRLNSVSDLCTRTLCNPNQPPNDFEVYDVFQHEYNCTSHLPVIANCLADGRDHIACCKREANDPDENECFGFCQGKAPILNISHWDRTKPYQTCLSINVESMYGCFLKGYRDNPGRPKQVQVRVTGMHSADLQWTRPRKNADKIDSYTVSYREKNSHKRLAKHLSSSQTRISLFGLKSHTNYSVQITALSDHSSESGYKRKSLPSNTVYFVTKGSAPKAKAYKSQLVAPVKAVSTTLACQIGDVGQGGLNVLWLKDDQNDNNFHLLDSRQKYGHVAYTATNGNFISTMEIRDIAESDYGLYQCVANNDYGTASAFIHLKAPEAMPAMPEAPPNITACCEYWGVKPECMSACQHEGPDRKRGFKAETMMPLQHCFQDFAKVMKCSTMDMDEGACCLRRKVPSTCLAMCGASPTTENNDMVVRQNVATECLLHMSEVLACRIENAHQLPQPVGHILSVVREGTNARLRWEATKRARQYHVYFRQKNLKNSIANWERVQFGGNEGRLSGLTADEDYEVVIVAANSFGRSGASRTFSLDQWTSSSSSSSTSQDYNDNGHGLNANHRMRSNGAMILEQGGVEVNNV